MNALVVIAHRVLLFTLGRKEPRADLVVWNDVLVKRNQVPTAEIQSAFYLCVGNRDHALVVGQSDFKGARQLGHDTLHALELSLDKDDVADVQIKAVVVVRIGTSLTREAHLHHRLYRLHLSGHLRKLLRCLLLFLISAETDFELHGNTSP